MTHFFRRSPFLISYWANGQLYFENYLTRRKISAAPEATAMLDYFTSWKSEAELYARWPGYTPGSLRKTVNELVRLTLLQKSARRNPPAGKLDKALLAWRAWDPGASYFHLTSKDEYPKEVTQAEIDSFEKFASESSVPQPLKKYRGSRSIQLPRGESAEQFARVLRERRTWRKFSREKVDEHVFGSLMQFSFGVQAWEKIPKVGRLAQKTSPSGGALHPCEAYVLVRRVKGIAPGLYHYDAGGNRLDELRKGASAQEIQSDLAGQWWFRDAAFVVFLTAVFKRTQWKYNYLRAYRAVLLEAGHLCQSFCLTATWLELAPFCTIAMADTQIERKLGVDGISESVIYAMGAGNKPTPVKAARSRG